jgi:probable phosphoglycerate mutase
LTAPAAPWNEAFALTPLRHLLLARHGETDWNVAGRWQGHTDVPLNATGRAQAAALAERLRTLGVAAVASSDLSRARHTAEIVAGALGLGVALVDPDLREQRFGRFEGLTPRECEARYPEEWARYVADRHAGPPGGESRAALLARVVRAVEGAASQLPGPALLVSHGGAIRALLAALPDAPGAAPAAAPGPIPNAGIVRVTLAAGKPVAAAWIGS